MKNYITQIAIFTFFIISLTAFSSCTNSTSSEEEEHEDAEGIRLKLNGAVVAEQLPGQSLTGAFVLTPGEETDLITVYFLDDHGDEFQPDEDEFTLGYNFDDEGIVEFEQHDEDGKWSFHLHAEAEGTTNMQIMLMHVGHTDFTSEDIPVQVETVE